MIRLTDLNKLTRTLSCVECGGEVSAERYSGSGDASECLRCGQCGASFKISNGIPRMLTHAMREALDHKAASADRRQIDTAASFGYEWSRFCEMYSEWEDNFLAYMRPHQSEFLRGKRVLDAGCGNGRHAYHAARLGAEVWAVDIGPAVEIARQNTMGRNCVQVVQADLNRLPFRRDYFDFIYSIGVLHHLPDPEGSFRSLLRHLKPGGEIQVYLYWKPEGEPVKRSLLSVVNAIRRVTTRMPFRVTYVLSYPAAAAAFAAFVWPYQLLSRIPPLKGLAESMPMKQYARYPFRVCVNDQFDRFSAPIENRYTRQEAEAWLQRAGLESIAILPNFGWNCSGRKPVLSADSLIRSEPISSDVCNPYSISRRNTLVR